MSPAGTLANRGTDMNIEAQILKAHAFRKMHDRSAIAAASMHRSTSLRDQGCRAWPNLRDSGSRA